MLRASRLTEESASPIRLTAPQIASVVLLPVNLPVASTFAKEMATEAWSFEVINLPVAALANSYKQCNLGIPLAWMITNS